MGVGEVAQGRAAGFQRPRQRAAQGRQQASSARAADAVSPQCRVDAGLEQCFAGVDVARAHHHVAGQQHGLDGRTALLQRSVQRRRRESGVEGLGAQPLQQPGRRILVQRRRPDDGAETPRVAQAQRAAVGDEVEMVVRPRRRGGRQQRQRTRHAQVQQQSTAAGRADMRRRVQRQPEVLATPRHVADGGTDQFQGGPAQRPAQGFAQSRGQHAGAQQRRRNAPPRDLDFGEFRHGSLCENDF